MNDEQMWDTLLAMGYSLVQVKDIMDDPETRERMRVSVRYARGVPGAPLGSGAPLDPSDPAYAVAMVREAEIGIAAGRREGGPEREASERRQTAEEEEAAEVESAMLGQLGSSVGGLGQYLAAAGVYGLTASEIDYQAIWETIVSEYGDELGPGFLVRPEEGPDFEDQMRGPNALQMRYRDRLESLAMAGVNEEMIVNSMSMWAQGVGQWKGPNDQRVERVQEISGLNAAQSRQIVAEAQRRGISVDLYARAAASVSRMGVHRYSAVAPSMLGISGDELQDVTEEPLVIGEARRRRAGGERRGSEVSRAIRPTSQGGEGLPLGQLSISRIGSGLVEQLSAFTSEASAIMALVDPALAAAFQNDPWGRSMQELERALEILGPDAEKDPRLAAETDWLWTRIRGGFQNTTKTVDTGTIREAARSLAAAWNLPDLTDGYLDSLASSYAAQYGMSLSDLYGNPFQDDPLAIPGQRTRTVQGADAMAADRLRGTAGYQDLFGNKTDGESEEQYVGRFEQMANFEFGPGYDGSTESVRAGMRSGESQDVRGHGMATGEAFDSMTFQERLHGLAAAFKAVT